MDSPQDTGFAVPHVVDASYPVRSVNVLTSWIDG